MKRNTLVLLNEKDGNRIINVVMASQRPEIYEDLKQMADYSFWSICEANCTR